MVGTKVFEEHVVANLTKKLKRSGLTLPEKYRILFSLRNCANGSALEPLLYALRDESALFRHDVAFALGQRQDSAAVAALIDVLNDANENSMVRHEAAEALGAIGTTQCLQPLRTHEGSDVRELAETCVLARKRVEYMAASGTTEERSKFQSVDPTPPLDGVFTSQELHDLVVDENTDLFLRYRALFSLRNRGGPEAVEAMAKCLETSSSALLKHEIAYVLGQLLDTQSVACLKAALQDDAEHPMVRHEAAEALGAIADDSCMEILKKYCTCSEPIVADSCIVALDMIEYERSGAFEYADPGDDPEPVQNASTVGVLLEASA
eukprot:jgi/Ulvmu1/10180/UM006_0136.1